MGKIYGILIIGFLILNCKNKSVDKKVIKEKVKFDQNLADELNNMAEVDQIAAYIPQDEYKKMTSEEWNYFKDSVFTTHQKRIAEIFKICGFVGYDLAGKEGSDNFWLMVQHSDHIPEFQRKVLMEMKNEVDRKNATPMYYAYLLDRVNINTGKEQVYGTQFDYNEFGQAFPKNISDTTGIDKRRESVGLDPMIKRMNEMTISHFLMNEELFKEHGIMEPKLYEK
jgi:hypothetical protein